MTNPYIVALCEKALKEMIATGWNIVTPFNLRSHVDGLSLLQALQFLVGVRDSGCADLFVRISCPVSSDEVLSDDLEWKGDLVDFDHHEYACSVCGDNHHFQIDIPILWDGIELFFVLKEESKIIQA